MFHTSPPPHCSQEVMFAVDLPWFQSRHGCHIFCSWVCFVSLKKCAHLKSERHQKRKQCVLWARGRPPSCWQSANFDSVRDLPAFFFSGQSSSPAASSTQRVTRKERRPVYRWLWRSWHCGVGLGRGEPKGKLEASVAAI